MRGRLVFLLALAGCTGSGSGASIDASTAHDVQVPDARLTGALTLTVEPAGLTLREGQRRTVWITVSGDIQVQQEAQIITESGVVGVSSETLLFGPNKPRRIGVDVTVPFDADERNAHDMISIELGGMLVEVPVVVVDPHLTIELELDAEQTRFVETSLDKKRHLSVPTVFSGEPGPIAEINMRGKGTLRCPRRSFTVRFNDPVIIKDSPPMKHVLLLSMCLDGNYLKMRSSVEILAGLGLFPAWFSWAEVKYGGKTRGVYLVVERPRKAIPRAFPGNTLVIRRLNDSVEELKRPTEDKTADRDSVLAPYRALYELRKQYRGEALLNALRAHMDYDSYLRWLAINSLLHNGDYIDEVYFYDLPGPEGSETPYFGIMAWDYDDIFKGCHTRGPLNEPLMFCSESGLDRPVRDHAAVKEAYVTHLRAIMNGPMVLDTYADLLDRVAGEMQVYLARPGVSEVMTRDGVPPDVEAGVAEMNEGAAKRRAELGVLLR